MISAAEMLPPIHRGPLSRHRGRKKALDERTGIVHYRMIVPRKGTPAALRLDADEYAVEAEVGRRGTFKRWLFPGLAIRMRDVLKR